MSKSNKLNISIVPIIILALIVVGVGYFAYQGKIELPGSSNGKMDIKRLEGYPTTVSTTKIIEKQRAVITSQDELNEFLNNIDESGTLAVAEKIDFDKEMVIGVSSKTLDTDGHRLKIKKVINDEEDNMLLVSAELEVPGETCEVETAPNVAVDLISIKKTDKKFDFERFKKELEC